MKMMKILCLCIVDIRAPWENGEFAIISETFAEMHDNREDGLVGIARVHTIQMLGNATVHSSKDQKSERPSRYIKGKLTNHVATFYLLPNPFMRLN